jgi:type VI secretion system protein ImpJ
MAGEGRVAWREGLFLRPQHFQQQDRHIDAQLRALAGGHGPYPWGVRELKVNGALAGLGKFAIERCVGVMPDGTPFSIPDSSPPPEPLDVPAGERDAVIYLTLVPRQAGSTEFGAAENPQVLTRFLVEEVEVFDAFASERASEPIEVARPNLRLGVTQGQVDGRVKLGLARLREVHAGALILDESYIAPCTDVRSGRLARMVEDSLGRTVQQVGELALRAAEATDGGSNTFNAYLILQTLNRWSPVLRHLSALPAVHPERLYETFASMLGDLSAMTRPDRQPPVTPAYDHENLQGCFDPLYEALQEALSVVVARSADLMPLRPLGPGSYAATITDHGRFKDSNFYLAVSARRPAEEIQRQAPDTIKVGSSLKMREIVTAAVQSNIPLSYVATPPPQIRPQPGFVYFELDRRSPGWAEFDAAPAVGVHVAGEWPELKLELWHVKRQGR